MQNVECRMQNYGSFLPRAKSNLQQKPECKNNSTFYIQHSALLNRQKGYLLPVEPIPPLSGEPKSSHSSKTRVG